MKKLMVIDGNSLVNRAFYGVRPLNTKDGLPTNAVFGFLSIIQKLMDEEKPDSMCVTFDMRAPTFRHIRYSEYKGHRKGMPEELAVQMPLVKEMLDAMAISRYELEGWEADDLIGTIAKKDTQAGWETVVVTGDKDALQLVTDTVRVKLVSTRMGKTTTKEMTPDAFREAYGFDPIYMIDLKALMGDASDNIPGVAGVGEKTAMDLLHRYHSLEEIYNDLEALDVKPGVRKKLTEGVEMANLSYELATISCEAPIDFAPEDALRKEIDKPALYELFLKLEFAKLIDRYNLAPEGGNAPAENATTLMEVTSSTLIQNEAQMEQVLSHCKSAPEVYLLPLPCLEGMGVVWPLGDGTCAGALALGSEFHQYKEFLQQLCTNDIKKVTHGQKKLMKELLDMGVTCEGFLFDTEVAAYLLSPTDGSYDLEKLGMAYCNQTFPKATYEEEQAFGPLSDKSGPMADLFTHCALVAALKDIFLVKLEGQGLMPLLTEVELPLCLVLAEMEVKGFSVDRTALQSYGAMLEERIATAKFIVLAEAGEDFNLNSTQQLGKILFEKLGLPPVKKTKTGYSTNAEVLEKLKGTHPIIDAIMEYRTLAKLHSTYVEGLGKVIGRDGRIHTCFQNTVTATGRLSSTEPNLQNIPVRTEVGAKLREMFVAEEGQVLVDADYSQIELRLLAHMAQDEAMIEAFRSGEDIHTVTASQVFGVTPEEVTSNMRRSAKAVNFGIVYGISAFSLSQDIGVPVYEAKDYIERYFSTYQGVHNYMTAVVEDAKEKGYVSTLMGRRRSLPELKSSNFNLRSFGERVALNMPIQGTAADLMKLAMIQVRDALLSEGLTGRLVLQVHDELIVECPKSEEAQVKALLAREMEGVAQLSVDLLAEAHGGTTWAQAKG